MRPDVKEFISLRNALYKEKARIEARLREIDEALEGPDSIGNGMFTLNGHGSPRRRGAGHGRGRRNVLSLKEAVLRVTSARALTKPEILEEVRKLGYKFTTSDPMNSLGVILYGKQPRFKRDEGRFSPE